MKDTLLALVLLLAPGALVVEGATQSKGPSPSYDCSRASGQVEELICGDPELAALDRKLADAYEAALDEASEDERATMRAFQRGWIKGRNDCWKAQDVRACVEESYRSRIEELSSDVRPFEETLELYGVTFRVFCLNSSSSPRLTIEPEGLEIDNRPIDVDVDGIVTGAEVADLNVDQSPELYVYVRSAGSGAFGSVVAYGANKRKSLSQVYLPPIEDNPEAVEGYRGHDEFAVVETTLVRRFPVYDAGDTDAAPTGGTRQLQYKLVAGEAGWILRVDKIVEY